MKKEIEDRFKESERTQKFLNEKIKSNYHWLAVHRDRIEELEERVEKLESMAETTAEERAKKGLETQLVKAKEGVEWLYRAFIKEEKQDIPGAKYKEPEKLDLNEIHDKLINSINETISQYELPEEKPTIFIEIDDSNIINYVVIGGSLATFTAGDLPKIEINRNYVVLYGGLEWKITEVKRDRDLGESIQCARVN